MQAALGVAPLNKRELIPPPRRLWKPARERFSSVSSEVSVQRHLEGLNTLHSRQPHTMCVCATPCRHQVLHTHKYIHTYTPAPDDSDVLSTAVCQSEEVKSSAKSAGVHH
ncbi:tight junction protein ZO-2-like isoform X4 [Xyrichtys novacula]|nr:tight junction protein ZO-2-like isoform X4 [Xyrichtys novacula]